MKIAVLVKQIPDVNKIRFDATTMRIVRTGTPLMMNPFDRKAMEEAVRIREIHGGSVHAVTMGPPSAREILIECMRLGADSCSLITDPIFAGADTLITSGILSSLIRRLRPELVLAGKYSLDGETSQVPPEISRMLGYSFKSSLSKIEVSPQQGIVSVEQEREDGTASFILPLPAVLSVTESINRVRMPSPFMDWMNERIETLGEAELSSFLRGYESPTVVQSSEGLFMDRKVEFLQMEESFPRIMDFIRTGKSVEVQEIALPAADPASSELWGMAIDDREIAFEIASKLGELSTQMSARVRILGNIPPDLLRGLPCHIYSHFDCSDNDIIASQIARMVQNAHPLCLLLPSTTDGREIAALIASALQIGLTADCIDFRFTDGRFIQYKPAFGGGVVASIISRSEPVMATVRPGMLRKKFGRDSFAVEEIIFSGTTNIRRTALSLLGAGYSDIRKTDVVIGIGRGVGSRERIADIAQLARTLDAAIACTRPLADNGWFHKQQQVGLTGCAISPRVYIALGISGQENHIVGLRYAWKIVAVNKRSDAPIFRYADVGIVGDMFEFAERFNEFIIGESRDRPIST